MRWFTLVAFILIFNNYADAGELQDNIEGTTQDPLGSSLITSYLTAVGVCAPFGLTTDGACDFLKLNIVAKIILQAKPDAASYIASNGEIKAAYLEQALTLLRKEYPNTSDMELAKAILAY